MDSSKKGKPHSRKDFFSRIIGKTDSKEEKMKLLTPDGKLVEVDAAIVKNATSRKKATNQSIYEWMDNPEKKKHQS